MGKETPNYMPNEKAFEPVETRPPIDTSFDPEKVVQFASRRFCEPSVGVYKNSPELMNDPIKAIGAVDWHGESLAAIDDSVEGLVVAAAKLTAAGNELNLTPKQRDVFSGFRQNLEGAIGFLDTIRTKAGSKAVRAVASGATIVTMALSAAGCGDLVGGGYVEITPTTSPVTEATPTNNFSESPLPFPTPSVSVTETEVSPQIDVAPYPISSENFTKIPSISGAEAENRIIELGVGGDLDAMKDWYRANGIADSNMLPVLYEQGGEVHWNLAAKSGNGNFLKFTITSGAEANQDVRAMGMVSYLYNRPTFKTSELKTPAELSGTTQEIMWDRSGWSVVGTFRDGGYSGWFNADQNMWIVENVQVVEPTKAAEYEPIHSSLEILGNVDGIPVTAIFAIGQDISDREEIPLDKWIINPKAEETMSSEVLQDKVAEVIMTAHYNAWKSHDYANRKNVPFSEYTQRIKDGEDMGYEIATSVPGSFVDFAIKKVDPLKPISFVLTNKTGGFSYGNSARDVSLFYFVKDDGSLRMDLFTSLDLMRTDQGVDFTKTDQLYSVEITSFLSSSLSVLSWDAEYQKSTANTLDTNAYSSKFYTERPEMNLIPGFFFLPGCETYEGCVTPLQVVRK